MSLTSGYSREANETAVRLGGLNSNSQSPGHNDKYDAFRHAYTSARAEQALPSFIAKWLGDSNEGPYEPDGKHKGMTEEEYKAERNMDLWNNNVGRQEYEKWKEAKDSGQTSDPLDKWIYDRVKEGATINDPSDSRRWSETDPPCLAPGTLIRTPSGNRPVEELQIGDLVLTPDGPQPLKFLGISTRHVNILKATGRMPIRIQVGGVFGHNLPSADIYCTPSHAFVLGDCLVEAQALINGQSIYQLEELSEYDQRHQREQCSTLAEQKETDSFTYYSLEFEKHVLVWANDLLTESYLPTYRDGELTRVAWNNYDNYLSLYGSSETMDELPISRIPFSRQIPLRIREQFGLLNSNGPSSAGISG